MNAGTGRAGKKRDMYRPLVYVVDDDPPLAAALAELLGREDYDTRTFLDARAVQSALERQVPDLLLLDLMLPDAEGTTVLTAAHSRDESLPVVMMSGKATVEAAVQALKLGAYDFLVKPLDPNRVRVVVRNALERGRHQRALALYRGQVEERYRLVGGSAALARVREAIGRVAPVDVTVLVTGESGTGKELVARQVHLQSQRSGGPFVAINCAAMPESLVESELFGIEKRVATGVDARPGRFERADRGTMFLDEIGEMGTGMQAKLLRVLQEQEFERVGGSEKVRVDVRLVTASNRNLEQAVADGRFREDLYYRLKVVTIHVPALREHREDVPELAQFFLQHYCAKHSRTTKLADGCLEVLRAFDWPGNVRQLQNVIEAAVIMAGNGEIDTEVVRGHLGVAAGAGDDPGLRGTRDQAERKAVEQALAVAGGNVTEAARILGVERQSLYRIMRRLGITPPRN